MAWKWQDDTGSHPYTFTNVCGRDYPVHCVTLETRQNVNIQKHGDKTVIRSLRPAKSIFGELIAPRPCFPSIVGLGPTCPLEGILHGGTLHLECLLLYPRYATQECVAYHVIDLETYNALGGLFGRGTEWPVPTLPYVPRAKQTTSGMPHGMFDASGRFKLSPSDN